MIEVLHGIHLEVRRNEIVALIGANGAGKTTMLMAISGLVPISGGQVRLEDRAIGGLPPERIVAAGVVQVPEGRRVFARLTVRENLAMGGFTRRPGPELEADFEEVLRLFPVLRERIGQRAGTLSGGEQQMLAIGRALMARPAVLLLDEPSLGLAPVMVARIFKILRKIHEQGRTILLVEQNARAALALADRGYVLETGRIALEGTGRELLANPRVRAAYLGETA